MKRLLSFGNFGVRKTCARLVAAAGVLAAHTGYAVQVDFQLTGPNSLLAEPFVVSVAQPMDAQDPAGTSLTTTYSGTVTVDVDDLTNPTSITFIAANAVAANSGSWLPAVGGGTVGDPGIDGDADPGNPAPANYGFVLDLGGPGAAVLYGASRDTILSWNAMAKPITAGQFDPSDINITIPQGTFDANLSSAAFGDDAGPDDITDLTGTNCPNLACSMGSYSVAGNVATLTLPIDFKIGGGTPEVRFTGTLVASYSLIQPLPGDYNQNGAVDAADYVVWREMMSIPEEERPNMPNVVNGGPRPAAEIDWSAWRHFFDETVAPPGAAGAVPEPASWLLASLAFCLVRRRASPRAAIVDASTCSGTSVSP
jgi:hypothetical protein